MLTRRTLVLWLVLSGCHGQLPATHTPPNGHGVLHDPSGHTVGAGIAVTLTDAATGEEFPSVFTDQAGQFSFSLPPGQYGIAATSPTQFAFAESIGLPSSPVITMSSDCHRVTGRVTGTLVLPAMISFSRFSQHVGDNFFTSIDPRGHANVCLPDGAYNTTITGGLTSLPVWIRVPEDTTISVSAFPTSEIQTAPRGVHLHSDDLSTFAQSLSAFTLIGMGEANHGTAEFYSYRGKLSLELARMGNLHAIFLEADAITMLAIDDYVMGKDVQVEKAVANVGFWITDVYEFIAILKDIRAHNAAVPPTSKIHVLGIDAQNVKPSLEFLLTHRTELAISEREAALASAVISDSGKSFISMSDDKHAAILALLDRLILPARSSDLTTISTRASIAARSLRLQLGYLGKPGIRVLRDQAMADLTQYVFSLTGTKQAAVWANNGHVSRIGRDGAKSLGEYLTGQFGARYYSIAFLSYRGIARAWDSSSKIGVIPHELAPTPTYNLESVVMQATGMPPAAWVRLDQPDQAWQRWLAKPRFIREFGSDFSLSGLQLLRMFPDDFPAVVVIDHTTPTTPTPTGVRKVP